METAKEMQCDLYMSSWDIKRAFDRVPKQLLIFAWVRLGVPPDVAECLVNIDRWGKTFFLIFSFYLITSTVATCAMRKG